MPVTFSIAFVAGVTPTKWTRIWESRRPEVPLEVFRTDAADQEAVLRDGRADVSLVRLPIDENGLSLIALYNEIPVVVVAKDHFVADADSVVVADLVEEHLLQDPDEVPEWRDAAVEVRDMDETMELVAAGVGIVIVPHSVARLHSRKDVVSRPVEDTAESRIALAWRTENTTPDVEEFIGIVRGRTRDSSRTNAVTAGDEPVKKEKKTAKAKAAAKAVRAAAAAAKPATPRKTQSAGRTRNSPSPQAGKRRGGR
jgi:DNA-binding transcriptional LysR family regulator